MLYFPSDTVKVKRVTSKVWLNLFLFIGESSVCIFIFLVFTEYFSLIGGTEFVKEKKRHFVIMTVFHTFFSHNCIKTIVRFGFCSYEILSHNYVKVLFFG